MGEGALSGEIVAALLYCWSELETEGRGSTQYLLKALRRVHVSTYFHTNWWLDLQVSL